MQVSDADTTQKNATEEALKDASDKDIEIIEKQLANLSFSTGDPPEVQRRIKAMKKLQVEMLEAECQFFKDLHDLETKYSSLYQKLCDKRGSIISGKHEPNEEECEFSLPSDEVNDGEGEDGKAKDEADKLNNNVSAAEVAANPINGIPRFWLTVFQGVPHLADMIEELDVPILEHLEDIKVELTKEPLGFQLDFKFSPNEYFTNSVLTKTYEMRCSVDPKDPFSFEGPEIIKSIGCTIDWKTGKNVTVREVKKKQKHKQSGAIRMVTKYDPCASFFNFFNPPQVEDTEEDDVEMDRMTTDFQIGQYLRERVIPRAVLYYTGEISASDDEEDDDYSTEADSDESEEGSASESGTGAEEENHQEAADNGANAD